MEKAFVESSMIEWIGYKDDSKTLVVAFVSGRKFEYTDVPREEYEELLQADSPGRYMKHSIIGIYEEIRLR